MADQPATFSEFINTNSNFLLSTFGIIGMGIAGCLLFVLKSRCRTIKCGCIECERDVIPTEELNNITLSNTRIPEV